LRLTPRPSVARRATEPVDYLSRLHESELAARELLEIEVVLLETAELVAEPRVLFEQRERGSPEILALGAESDEVRDPVLADERRRHHRHAGEQQHHAQQPSTRHAHSAKCLTESVHGG